MDPPSGGQGGRISIDYNPERKPELATAYEEERRAKSREAAKKSREKKKLHFLSLAQENEQLHTELEYLREKATRTNISLLLTGENQLIRQSLQTNLPDLIYASIKNVIQLRKETHLTVGRAISELSQILPPIAMLEVRVWFMCTWLRLKRSGVVPSNDPLLMAIWESDGPLHQNLTPAQRESILRHIEANLARLTRLANDMRQLRKLVEDMQRLGARLEVEAPWFESEFTAKLHGIVSPEQVAVRWRFVEANMAALQEMAVGFRFPVPGSTSATASPAPPRPAPAPAPAPAPDAPLGPPQPFPFAAPALVGGAPVQLPAFFAVPPGAAPFQAALPFGLMSVPAHFFPAAAPPHAFVPLVAPAVDHAAAAAAASSSSAAAAASTSASAAASAPAAVAAAAAAAPAPAPALAAEQRKRGAGDLWLNLPSERQAPPAPGAGPSVHPDAILGLIRHTIMREVSQLFGEHAAEPTFVPVPFAASAGTGASAGGSVGSPSSEGSGGSMAGTPPFFGVPAGPVPFDVASGALLQSMMAGDGGLARTTLDLQLGRISSD